MGRKAMPGDYVISKKHNVPAERDSSGIWTVIYKDKKYIWAMKAAGIGWQMGKRLVDSKNKNSNSYMIEGNYQFLHNLLNDFRELMPHSRWNGDIKKLLDDTLEASKWVKDTFAALELKP